METIILLSLALIEASVITFLALSNYGKRK